MLLTSIATSTPSTATLTQRQGCRTGTALISSGGTVPARGVVSGGAVTARLSRGAVDHRVGDRAGGDAPLVEHRLVGAVFDQRLDRAEDRVLGGPGVLGYRDPVRRGVVDVAD